MLFFTQLAWARLSDGLIRKVIYLSYSAGFFSFKLSEKVWVMIWNLGASFQWNLSLLVHQQLMIQHSQSLAGSQLFNAVFLLAVHRHTFAVWSYSERTFASATAGGRCNIPCTPSSHAPRELWFRVPRQVVHVAEKISISAFAAPKTLSGLSPCSVWPSRPHLFRPLCSLACWRGYPCRSSCSLACLTVLQWCPQPLSLAQLPALSCTTQHYFPNGQAHPEDLYNVKKAKGNFNRLLYAFHCSEAILFKQALGRISESSRGSITMKRWLKNR